MKKIIISILILILAVFTIFQTNTYASSLSLSTSKSEVKVGDTISVTVSFGQKVAAADVTLSFDSSKFAYKSVSKGTANSTGSSIVVSYFDSTGGSNPTSSITFTFTAISTGSGKFSAKCSSAADSNVNTVTISGSPSKTVTVKKEESTSSTNTKKDTTTNTSKNNTSTKNNTAKNTTKTETPTEEVKSNNANLSSINIEGFSLTPEFNKDTTKYYLSVNQDVNSLNISATSEDESSKFEISGNENLQFGINTVKIKSTAEDGTVKEYEIEVNKEDTTLGLSYLLISLNGQNIDFSPEFDKNTLNYTLDVENASALDIEALANYEAIRISITGNENLKNGENVITINVQKDEEVKTYTLTVNNTVENESLFEQITSFARNTWLILIVSICALLQSSIAIYYATMSYKNSNSSK